MVLSCLAGGRRVILLEEDDEEEVLGFRDEVDEEEARDLEDLVDDPLPLPGGLTAIARQEVFRRGLPLSQEIVVGCFLCKKSYAKNVWI